MSPSEANLINSTFYYYHTYYYKYITNIQFSKNQGLS